MEMRTLRTIPQTFETREDGDLRVIEGYFAVFDSVYQIADGMSESINRHAFDKTISGDIRCLINHDTTLVLGRTKAHTLELRVDEHGLWGKALINPNDTDAMNLWARVQRGDVDGCSIGFEIVKESTETRNDGSIHWEIQEMNLFEVSACTFPAYTETDIKARSHEADEIRKRNRQAWQETMLRRLKGE